MKLTSPVPLSLAAITLGSLPLLNADVRAIPHVFRSPDRRANSPENAAMACLKEAEQRKIRRPVIGDDHSATRGVVEIDTANTVFLCRVRGKRVVSFKRHS